MPASGPPQTQDLRRLVLPIGLATAMAIRLARAQMLYMATAEGRRLIAPGTAVGVTEEMIRTLVQVFYGRVRKDSALGPIFNEAVGDWENHLEKLADFWSSVTL